MSLIWASHSVSHIQDGLVIVSKPSPINMKIGMAKDGWLYGPIVFYDQLRIVLILSSAHNHVHDVPWRLLWHTNYIIFGNSEVFQFLLFSQEHFFTKENEDYNFLIFKLFFNFRS
jgi:hypothetical protein